MSRRQLGPALSFAFGLFTVYATIGPLVDGDPEVGPPLPISVLFGFAALAILGAAAQAWRGSTSAARVAGAFTALIVFLLVPVFFIEHVPALDKVLLGLGVLLGIASLVVTFGDRRTVTQA